MFDPIDLLFDSVPGQEGLENIPGTPFYHTPNTPANPQDCNRWGNSIYCGENPVSLDTFAENSFELVRDECNFGVSISPTLGFISLPEVQFVYRNPDCAPPEQPPPTRGRKDPGKYASVRFNPLSKEDVFIGLIPYYLEYADGLGEVALELTEIIAKVTYHGRIRDRFLQNGRPATHIIISQAERQVIVNSAWVKGFRIYGGTTLESYAELWRNDGGTIEGELEDDYTIWKTYRSATYTCYVNSIFQDIEYEVSGDGRATGAPWVFRRSPLGDPFKQQNTNSISYVDDEIYVRNPEDFPKDVPSDYEPRQLEIASQGVDFYGNYYVIPRRRYFVNEVFYQYIQLDSDRIPPPPPPPPPKEDDDMDCCQNNDRLLRLILYRIGALPANVPNSLVRANSGTKQIKSLAEYIAYSTIQTNAQFGQFPQEINIEDADLTQEGNQGKNLKLPNLAESIAEIIGMLLVLQSESNANLIATINAMLEAGGAKQAATIARDYAAGNAEFLGYKGKQVERSIQFTFKPGESRLSKMLEPTEVKIKTWDNDDKNDINDVISPLLEMAAAYRAQNFRNVGTSDTFEKIKSILTNGANLATAIDSLVNNPPPPSDPDAPPYQPKKSSWDEFVEQAESGFIAKPGITDNLHPYGRELERRPKIREFGADTSEEPNAEE